MAIRKEGLIMGGIAIVAFLLGMGASSLMMGKDQDKGEDIPERRLIAAKPVKEVVAVRDQASDKEIATLKKTIAGLREELGRASVAAAAPVAAVPAPAKEGQKKAPKWISFRENLERMKTENPKRYEELQERFKKVREMAQENEYSRAEYLSSIDPGQLTPKQRDAHEQLLDLLERMNQLREEIGGPGLATEEQRKELRATYREMSQLLQVEQKSLLAATAKSMGYQGDAVREFTAQMQDIIRATSVGFRGPGYGIGRKMMGGDRGKGPMPPADQ